MSKGKVIGLILLGIVVIVGVVWGVGYLGVGYTKTVGKAKKNAETEVFYETQSFVEGKKQDALKLYNEYKELGSNDEKLAMKKIIRIQFANFDEEEHLTEPLKTFIHDCKYN